MADQRQSALIQIKAQVEAANRGGLIRIATSFDAMGAVMLAIDHAIIAFATTPLRAP